MEDLEEEDCELELEFLDGALVLKNSSRSLGVGAPALRTTGEEE